MADNPRLAPDVYLDEYTRQAIIARYLAESAGVGIAYVLTHVYAPVYSEAITALRRLRPEGHPFRILEYGCGGGMNLLKIIELIQAQGGRLERAFGADFSPPMVEAARREAARYLPADLNAKINFVVASNETLAADLARGLRVPPAELNNSMDLVVGVNTFRYAHRLQRAKDCAGDIFRMLRPGGFSIMIDMNRRFPLFRSRLRDRLTRPKHEYYLPSLKEYASPFQAQGFDVQQVRNFCWIPHSASASLLRVCRALTPVLDTCCSPFAMRSLVVAQKPG